MSTRTKYFAEAIFLVIFFILINLRSIIFWGLFPSVDLFSGQAWIEVQIWFVIMLLLGYLIEKQNLINQYITGWRSHPLLLFFVLFSSISIIWSATWEETLYRGLGFLFATLSSVYIGIRYSDEKFMDILFWFSFIVIVLSMITILLYPFLGTDLNPPYNGAWRGIFWHKNHLGNLLPFFAVVFLVQALRAYTSGTKLKIYVAILLYIVSLLMLWMTNSASGYIVAIILHGAFILALLWIRYASRMQPVHYYFAVGAFLLIGIMTLSNLDYALGVFNRSTSFTGRVPLWVYLLQHEVLSRLWLGNGFGATWSDLDFRIFMRDVLGWSYPVMIGDNGFVDILLNLGLVGLLLFIAVYIEGWIRLVRQFIIGRSLLQLFPLIFVLYTLFANLTYSLFFETEMFVWSIFVVFLVAANRENK